MGSWCYVLLIYLTNCFYFVLIVITCNTTRLFLFSFLNLLVNLTKLMVLYPWFLFITESFLLDAWCFVCWWYGYSHFITIIDLQNIGTFSKETCSSWKAFNIILLSNTYNFNEFLFSNNLSFIFLKLFFSSARFYNLLTLKSFLPKKLLTLYYSQTHITSMNFFFRTTCIFFFLYFFAHQLDFTIPWLLNLFYQIYLVS